MDNNKCRRRAVTIKEKYNSHTLLLTICQVALYLDNPVQLKAIPKTQ